MAEATRKKAPVRRSSTRKTATPKAAASTRSASKRSEQPGSSKPEAANSRLQGAVKEMAYAQLGIVGKVYDQLNERVSRARKDAPKQWEQLVKRGEQVQRDLDKAREEVRRDLGKRIDTAEARARLEQRIETIRANVEKLKSRVRKAA
jgi:Tfp pilus assembly protein PilF